MCDDAALTTLIQQHEPRVYALARAILKTPEWAEDATQETFLRVVQAAPKINVAEFQTWVLCVARNVAISMWRKRQHRDAVFELDEKFDEPLADEMQISPLEQAIAQEDASSVMRAIDELPGHLREVLVLRFFHNLEPGEIGRVVEISSGNVRTRLSRALQELRRRLA